MFESIPSQQDLRVESGPEWSACTARGSARARNSDAWAVSRAGICLAFAIADGVGTMEGSAAASTAASKAVVAWARRQNTARLSDMPALLSEVNAAVGKALRKKGQGGATTLACALVSRDGCVVATVGDSEVLAVDYSGPACRLNQLDHLPARPNMLLAWIDGDVEVEPHLIELETLPHRLCLVTDGVSQAVDGQRLANLLRDAPPSKAAEVLVIEALSGGATDDVTALVLAPRVLLNSSRSAVSE